MEIPKELARSRIFYQLKERYIMKNFTDYLRKVAQKVSTTPIKDSDDLGQWIEQLDKSDLIDYADDYKVEFLKEWNKKKKNDGLIPTIDLLLEELEEGKKDAHPVLEYMASGWKKDL